MSEPWHRTRRGYMWIYISQNEGYIFWSLTNAIKYDFLPQTQIF